MEKKIIPLQWDPNSVGMISYLGRMNSFSYKRFVFKKWNSPFWWIPLRWDASTHMNSFLFYYMSTKQRRILLKTFIESQFAYCPLVLMFHSRILNSKINHLHERTLRIETMTVHAKIYLKWPISAEKHTIFSHLIVKGQIEQLNTHDEQYIPDER